jgi:hypothetical protein
MKTAESKSVVAGSNGVSLVGNIVAAGVVVPKRQEVIDYLSRFPDLEPIVPAICASMRQSFGPEAELSLELYRDPEIDDRFVILYVRLPKYDQTIMERIDTACRPFDAAREAAEGYFLVTTDFRAVRGSHAV